MFKAQKRANKIFNNLIIPTLFLVAGDDREVSSKYTIKKCGQIIKNKDMKIKIFKDNFHENFNEPSENLDAILHEIERFILDK